MTTTSPYSKHDWVDVPVGGTPPVGAPDLEEQELNEIEDGIAGAYDFFPGEVFRVLKDDATGVWPAGWSWRNPIYSGGVVDASVRPTADPSVLIIWQGDDPSPGIADPGDVNGMFEHDIRDVENP